MLQASWYKTVFTATTTIMTKTTYSVPKWRIYLMCGLFFLNFFGLAFDNWSAIFFPNEQQDTLSGVAISFWAAFSLLNLLGVRFPLKFVPILLLQLLYKSAWIIGTYLPAYTSNTLDDNLRSFLWVCVAGIVLNLFIIPWRYVYQEYIRGFLRRQPSMA